MEGLGWFCIVCFGGGMGEVYERSWTCYCFVLCVCFVFCIFLLYVNVFCVCVLPLLCVLK